MSKAKEILNKISEAEELKINPKGSESPDPEEFDPENMSGIDKNTLPAIEKYLGAKLKDLVWLDTEPTDDEIWDRKKYVSGEKKIVGSEVFSLVTVTIGGKKVKAAIYQDASPIGFLVNKKDSK